MGGAAGIPSGSFSVSWAAVEVSIAALRVQGIVKDDKEHVH